MLLAVHPFSSEHHDFVDLDEKMGAIALSWIFLSSRIGFVLTVSATWQIAKSFGKQHPRVGFIYTATADTFMQNTIIQIIQTGNGIIDIQRELGKVS